MTDSYTLQQLSGPGSRHRRHRPPVILTLVAVLAAALLAAGWFAYDHYVPTQSAAAIKQAPMSGLIPACQQAVKIWLKSPGSAQFGGEAVAGRDPYIVTGWVDSQNGFGALVRNRYQCRAWRGELGWRAEDPTFSDW